ncbi:MAG: DUF6273 domain-containing protein [Lachnospiraceae bacterium]|nr:DUF6273 domain-containing protein [Lachnospiraceae bacterium]
MFCKKCGAEIKNNVAFCPKCGFKVTDGGENSETKSVSTEKRAEVCRKDAKKRKKTIAIVTPIIIIACIAFVIVLTTVIIPGNKYSSAMELYNSQQYEEAYKAFNSLNFKDSADKAADCLFLQQKPGLTNVTVGSTIKFGFYEQDNNRSNGKEEIEWKVLAVEGNRIFVISQYALDYQPYNSSGTNTTWETNVTWETCTLRKWLNETFYNTAFGTYHQQMVSSSTVTADNNPNYDTSPGNSTTDQVFLLSITEAEKYFGSDGARQCQGTAYCYAQRPDKSDNGNCSWWLRTPGYEPIGSGSWEYADVLYDGSVEYYGSNVGNSLAVRPALWINLGS